MVSISDNEFLVADTDKFVELNRIIEASEMFLDFEFKTSNVRFNDGKVDPNGNLWIGIMELNLVP